MEPFESVLKLVFWKIFVRVSVEAAVDAGRYVVEAASSNVVACWVIVKEWSSREPYRVEIEDAAPKLETGAMRYIVVKETKGRDANLHVYRVHGTGRISHFHSSEDDAVHESN